MDQVMGKQSILKQILLVCQTGVNDLFTNEGAVSDERLFAKQWAYSAITNKLGLEVGPPIETFRQLGGSAVYAYPEFSYYQKYVAKQSNLTYLGRDSENLVSITEGSF